MLRWSGHRADTPFVVGEEFAVVLAAAQGGDEAEFSLLWRGTNPALLRYLRAIAPDVADDVAAETWVHVIRNLARFRGDETAWRAWLFTTARRRLLDQARQRRRHPAVPLDALQPMEEPRVSDAASLALDHFATQRALALVAQLPRQQAEVIMLRVVGGLDTETVAGIVGSTPGAVRVATHRALRRLAALFAEAGVTL
jgi:RNA polymerase sigma-70 factor (ECF subfamily)